MQVVDGAVWQIFGRLLELVVETAAALDGRQAAGHHWRSHVWLRPSREKPM
jgi:hypothetical protein